MRVAAVQGPHPVDRSIAMPLWAQVDSDLRRRLSAEEFSATFPGELALMEQYTVSRSTIREALRHLREEGLVIARPGRPPRQGAPPEITQPLGALYSLFASVEAAGQQQRSIVRVLDVRADGVPARHLGLEESTPLLHLERVRFADDEPLAVDRVWLPANLARPLLEADFSHTSLYQQLARRCNIRLTGGQEQLRAIVPSPAECALLDVLPGVAAFAIDRVGCADGQPIEWRQTIVRGDRFTMTAQFTSRSGYRLDLASVPTRPRPTDVRGQRCSHND